METFNVRLIKQIDIYEDNLGALNIAKYGNFTTNSQLSEVHYHYVHECVQEKVINIIKVSLDDNIADIFTKALH